MLWLSLWFFCFFKQKTAYELRISDWSSDVCSSDLVDEPQGHRHPLSDVRDRRRHRRRRHVGHDAPRTRRAGHPVSAWLGAILRSRCGRYAGQAFLERADYRARARSEEHTSELQSLMRISYDVFFLKKTTENKRIRKYTQTIINDTASNK